MRMRRKGSSTLVLLALIQGLLVSSALEIHPSTNPVVVGDNVTLSPSAALTGGSWAVGEAFILNWSGEQEAVYPSHKGRASVDHQTGALTLSSVTVADSGVYTVQSSNPQLKASVSITVLEPVSNVTIKANEIDLRESSSSAVMRCSVSSGSSTSFLWINGSSVVTASDRVQLQDGNSTLTIFNVTRYDQGPFVCVVTNAVSNGTSSPLNFTISYGPDNMAVTMNGQNTTSVSAGSNLTIVCSAQSHPPAQLQWAFKGETVNTTGPVLELFNVKENQSGPYSCLAFNNQTLMSSNITTDIRISALSGSEQQASNMCLLPLMLWIRFLF